MTAAPLAGVLVAELGERAGVSACGCLLAQLGATVVMIELRSPGAPPRNAGKTPFAYGKYSVGWDPSNPGDCAFAREIVDAAGIVLLSTDVDTASAAEIVARCGQRPVVCDITATGATGPLAGQALSDAMIQALCGIMDTTGLADGPPVEIGIPVAELSTAIYAAAAVVTAWRVWRTQGIAQKVDMALYDAAVNSLTTFLPGHFGGGSTSRLGNGHSMGVPWNAYAAADGWVLLCSTADAHWQKICAIIGRPELADDARFSRIAGRVARRSEVDLIVSSWMSTQSVAECIDKLGRAGVACGEIVEVRDLPGQINLVHRRKIVRTHDPVTGHTVALIGSVLGAPDWPVTAPARIPAPDSDREHVRALLPAAASAAAEPVGTVTGKTGSARMPLAGMRVIEIGQFTTAPLVGRHLAMLGAEVVKIEPPEGEAARTWSPHRAGMSLFFMMSNSGKRSLAVDLRSDEGRQLLRDLVANADVLVENLKPGSLARLGFSPATLLAINPRLIYCAICGFGADSAYTGKPAFDTVVQAMSGIMDATRYRGMPLKAGISIADICGGQFGLLAILAALEHRDATGKGRYLDISMQDAGAWLTQTAWNRKPEQPLPRNTPLRCRDGYVLVQAHGDQSRLGEIARQAPELNRDAVTDTCLRTGIACVPVQTVAEIANHPHTCARELIVHRATPEGIAWELLGSPLRLNVTPPAIGAPIGKPAKPERTYLIEQGLLPGTDCPARRSTSRLA
jgi:crotonobetainyl-CoA:carnitine CoA-transferase CaiB-like acyl-CoA transferase